MYSGDIKRRNPPGQGQNTSHQGHEHEGEDPYGPNPQKPTFFQQSSSTTVHHQQQQQHYQQHVIHRQQQQHYYSREHSTHPQRKVYSSNKYIAFYQQNDGLVISLVLTVLALWTRFRDISASNIVVWDEFGSYYIKGDFYFDVHPPLGKILVGLSGLLAGYNGLFDFGSGATYPDNVNYTVMRIFNAFFGAIIVPMAYWTARELRMSKVASLFAATLVLFDNAYLTISRFILLDSMLLAGTCLVVLCMTRFRNERHDPFSLDWWLWLALTGVSIGIVSSIKWVGLFVTALVGLLTVEELWDLFGDLSIPKSTYVKHWVARAACLIALPFAVYVSSFALHFAILQNSGPGDAQMSSLFQAGLNGNDFYTNPLGTVIRLASNEPIPPVVAYGSMVTIKSAGYGGGLLHSHIQTFPEGSGQQQVTCYHHKDTNNNWVFTRPQSADNSTADEIQFVKDGDTLRLSHEQTKKFLHSHRIKAPVTGSQWEVSGYGNEETTDFNDEWVVEIVEDVSRHPKNGVLRSLTTSFRLRHKAVGCLLSAENRNLPQWGFRQIEVTCDDRNRVNSAYSIWNVEQHWNDKLPAGEKGNYKSSFWKDFWHLNVAMMTSNNALIPDPDKEDILASTPSQWPFLGVGLRMCGWGDETIKFYLLGNPIAWWGGTLSLIVFILFLSYYLVRRQRKLQDMSAVEWDHFQYVGKVLVGGWVLHYLPFCIMGPGPTGGASTSTASEKATKAAEASRIRAIALWTVAFSAVILTFIWFWPVTYGIYGSANDTMKGRQWRSAWNIIDQHKPGNFL
ncbi:Protein O-mannosyltransferase 2 [Lunasporangiospora selenospora]|uniref:Dolichyl-phosphate-mannose--protein mannosyltransferase n=1 Tax=Lunasporangiospora selenospora TaxID=979761 RepID=A0A9P6FSZ7_9FUNG|nr:Protein O-mannosyltransferase 2 [Lunasporangiospora selenospora]